MIADHNDGPRTCSLCEHLAGCQSPEACTALREAYEAFVKRSGTLADSFGLSYLERIDDPFYEQAEEDRRRRSTLRDLILAAAALLAVLGTLALINWR